MYNEYINLALRSFSANYIIELAEKYSFNRKSRQEAI